MKESYITAIMNKKATLNGENNEKIRSCLDTLVMNLQEGEDSTEKISKLLTEAREEIRQQKARKMPKVTFKGDDSVAGSLPYFNRDIVQPHKDILKCLDGLIGQCTIEVPGKENCLRLSQIAHKDKKGNTNNGVLKMSLDSKVTSRSGVFHFDFDVNELIRAAENQNQTPQSSNGAKSAL